MAKGCKEMKLYPIPVTGIQSLARKRKDLNLFISDLIEVCLKRIFQESTRRQKSGCMEIE